MHRSALSAGARRAVLAAPSPFCDADLGSPLELRPLSMAEARAQRQQTIAKLEALLVRGPVLCVLFSQVEAQVRTHRAALWN